MILKIIIGAVIGGALGFAYQRLVGCSSGACPLTSSPWITTIYGMVVGGMIGGTAH
ncbi:MAG: YtxH domain-containing protein [Verrucomicrobia bacterium]|nr:YtxH domain-containing protein [Verrucomicrobiota bacterium]